MKVRTKRVLTFQNGLVKRYDDSHDGFCSDFKNITIDSDKARVRQGSTLMLPVGSDGYAWDMVAPTSLGLFLVEASSKLVYFCRQPQKIYRVRTTTYSTIVDMYPFDKYFETDQYIFFIQTKGKAYRLAKNGMMKYVSSSVVSFDIIEVTNLPAPEIYTTLSDMGLPMQGDYRVASVNQAGVISKLSEPLTIRNWGKYLFHTAPSILSTNYRGEVIGAQPTYPTSSIGSNYIYSRVGLGGTNGSYEGTSATYTGVCAFLDDLGLVNVIFNNMTIEQRDAIVNAGRQLFKLTVEITQDLSNSSFTIADGATNTTHYNIGSRTSTKRELILQYEGDGYETYATTFTPTALTGTVNKTSFTSPDKITYQMAILDVPATGSSFIIKFRTDDKALFGDTEDRNPVMYKNISGNIGYLRYSLYFVETATFAFCNIAFKTFEGSPVFIQHLGFNLWDKISDIKLYINGKTLQVNKTLEIAVVPNTTTSTKFTVFYDNNIIGFNQTIQAPTDGSNIYESNDDSVFESNIPIFCNEGMTLFQFPYEYQQNEIMTDVFDVVWNNGRLFVNNGGLLWLSDETLLLKARVKLDGTIRFMEAIYDGCLVFTDRTVYKVNVDGTFFIVSDGVPAKNICKADGSVVAVGVDDKIYAYSVQYIDKIPMIRATIISENISDIVFAEKPAMTYADKAVWVQYTEHDVIGFGGAGWTRNVSVNDYITKLFTLNDKLLIEIEKDYNPAEGYDNDKSTTIWDGRVLPYSGVLTGSVTFTFDGALATIKISISYDNGNTYQTLGTTNTGSFNWTVPAEYKGVDVLIKFESGLTTLINTYTLNAVDRPEYLLNSSVTITQGTLPVNPTFLNSEITISEGAI